MPLPSKPTFPNSARIGTLLRLVEENTFGVRRIEIRYRKSISPTPVRRCSGSTKTNEIKPCSKNAHSKTPAEMTFPSSSRTGVASLPTARRMQSVRPVFIDSPANADIELISSRFALQSVARRFFDTCQKACEHCREYECKAGSADYFFGQRNPRTRNQ